MTNDTPEQRTVTLDDDLLLTVYSSGMVSGIATFLSNEMGVPPNLAEQAGTHLAAIAFNDPAARHEMLRLLHGWIDGSIPRQRVIVTAYNARGGDDE